MKLTQRKDININSLTLQHNILLQAMLLLEGREGVLETEKKLYLMLTMVDFVVEENLLELCNADERDLSTIMMVEIEPFFNTLMKDEEYKEVFEYLSTVLLDRCQEIWDNQHSIVGIFDAFLTAMSTLTDEDKKGVLTEAAKAAEAVYKDRTKTMEDKADKINSKLEEMVARYQRESQNIIKNKEEKTI